MSQSKDLRTVAVHLLLFGICTVMVLMSFPWPATAQIYVYPRRPNQSNVKYFDFEWHHEDIEIGPEANTEGADLLEPERFFEKFARSFNRFAPEFDELSHRHDLLGHSRHHGTVDFQSSSPPASITDFPDPAEDTASDPPEPSFEEDESEDTPEPASRFEATDLYDRRGGVRLYFYERERDIAERASAFIEITYRDLVDTFRHVPTETLPYVLYNSYQEFLQTNIFPVQEGVLGVTGRADLQLVLPYFGDHRLFQHISTHEMVHQFQIQKARDVVEEAGVSGDPLDRMPLWFIEGMAEYYSLDGLDPEAEMLTRDLLLNPDPSQGYVMLDFFEDRPQSQLWTYKIGQSRIAFIEDHYGEGTVQTVLESSYLLVGNPNGSRDTQSFRSLLSDVTGDPPRKIAANFDEWIKNRSYRSYLDSRQDTAVLNFLNETSGMVQTMTSSPDGHLLMYRSIQQSTGQVRLYLTDARAPDQASRVASDGKPGVESLHPVGPRNFAVHDDKVAFFARTEGRDILYLTELDHSADQNEEGEWDIRLDLDDRTGYDLTEHDLLAAETPAFSPDGRRIAFIGLDNDGQKDIYLFEPLEGDDSILTQLTDDPYAERGISWGDEQIVYTSDATGHGKYNLFCINLMSDEGEPDRLTFEERDHFEPRVMPDGRLFFSAFTDSRSNLYEYTGDGIVRRTDMVTGLFDVAPGPGRSLWATYHYRGQRQLVRIANDDLIEIDVESDDEDPSEPGEFPILALDDAPAYSATDLQNWQISNIFGILGASSAGIFGQLMLLTNDRLRNHALFVNVLAFGDLNNTVADFLYLNQSNRLIWGAGAFQDVRYRIDRTLEPAIDEAFDGEQPSQFLSGERFYGARGSLRWPFDRFSFIQGDLAIGGVSFFLQDGTRDRIEQLEDRDDAPAGANFLEPWEEQHDDHRFQTSPSVSLGYNTIRFHPGTGPIDGTSALLEGTLDLQPFNEEAHGQIRLDAERYFPIYDRINFSLRMGAGSTFGGVLARQFYLSSFDTLRGVEFGDTRYLLGNQFFFSKAEIRFPLNFILRVPLIDIEGMVGADFGGAGRDLEDLWRWRAFSPVVGLNFGLGPLVFRLHFAKPIGIGAPELPRGGDWITNFSLGWRYW